MATKAAVLKRVGRYLEANWTLPAAAAAEVRAAWEAGGRAAARVVTGRYVADAYRETELSLLFD